MSNRLFQSIINPDLVQKIVFYVLIVLVAFAPFALGGNRSWAWSVMSACVALLVLMDAASSSWQDVEETFLRRVGGLVLCFFIPFGWGVMQLLPLEVFNFQHPIWAEASARLGVDVMEFTTISPAATSNALMLMVTYGGVFWLSSRIGRRGARANLLLWLVVVVFTAYAVYGLIVFFSKWELVLWFRKEAYIGDLTSTFINRNSYATYAAMGSLLSICLLYGLLIEAVGKSKGGRSRLDSRTLQQVLWQAALAVLGVLLNFSALYLSHSRAGLAAFVASMLVVAVLVGACGRKRKKTVIYFWGVMIACLGFVSALSASFTLTRIAFTDFLREHRFELYADVVAAIQNEPVLGTGYGTFEPAFRVFKDLQTPVATWDKAHNTYLETFMEFGVVAASAFYLIFIFMGWRLLMGCFVRKRNAHFSLIGIGVLILIGGHALVDFSMQIPGVAITAMVLLGVAWAQSFPTRMIKHKNY